MAEAQSAANERNRAQLSAGLGEYHDKQTLASLQISLLSGAHEERTSRHTRLQLCSGCRASAMLMMIDHSRNAGRIISLQPHSLGQTVSRGARVSLAL